MKTEGFNALCHREHEQDSGCVVKLYLTAESLVELTNDVLAAGPVEFPGGAPSPGPAGARLDTMTNPATHTPVSISLGVPKALFADTAEVTRWVVA